MQFGVRNPSLKKQVDLYEIESIGNPNTVVIAVNPKEYFEKYKDKCEDITNSKLYDKLPI